MAESKIRKLTPRQREIYDFVKDRIENRGYGPTVREIGNRFGIRSPNGVMCHLKALEKKGLIIRESHLSRAIQLADWKRKWGVGVAGDLARGNIRRRSGSEERADFSDIINSDNFECYRVADNSLADQHICSGDYVVVPKRESESDEAPQPYANQAQVLAAMVGLIRRR